MNRRMENIIRLLAILAAGALLLPMLGCSSSSDNSNQGPLVLTNSVALADLDGSGKLAIVSANAIYGNGAPHPGFLTVFRQGTGQPGTFTASPHFNTGSDPSSLVLADLNGDGRPDVVLAPSQLAGPLATTSISVLFQDASGNFGTDSGPSVGQRNPVDVAVGDLNGDGKPDIAVAAGGASNVLVFLQGSGGNFAAPISFPVGGDPMAVAIGDLNGDGKPDLAVATSAGTVSVLLQDPANPGSFLTFVDYPVGSQPVSVRIADLNGDGKADLIVANYGDPSTPDTFGLSLLLQDPAHPGTFLPQVSLDMGDYRSTSVAVGDLNGDGLPDIVVANSGLSGFPGSVTVLLNDPNHPGTFGSPQYYQGYFGPFSVAIGDMDGDGRPDLVIADGGVEVRYQNPASPGTFKPPLFLNP